MGVCLPVSASPARRRFALRQRARRRRRQLGRAQKLRDHGGGRARDAAQAGRAWHRPARRPRSGPRRARVRPIGPSLLRSSSPRRPGAASHHRESIRLRTTPRSLHRCPLPAPLTASARNTCWERASQLASRPPGWVRPALRLSGKRPTARRRGGEHDGVEAPAWRNAAGRRRGSMSLAGWGWIPPEIAFAVCGAYGIAAVSPRALPVTCRAHIGLGGASLHTDSPEQTCA